MNILTLTGTVVVLTIILGAVLAAVFGFASRAVTSAQAGQEQEKSSYNPALTRGHKISVTADVATQLKQARLLAAKKAAALPRWGNMKIRGYNEMTKAPSAFKGVDHDSLTAVKIAEFHTWPGVRSGPPSVHGAAAPAGAAAAPVAAPARSPEDLVAGVDYAVVEITEAMSPEDVRKARIANSKARSAAMKALKDAGAAAAAPTAAVTASAAPRAAAPAAATAVGAVREPVAGVDYAVIEITDSMSPDEVRKARIANSKTRSAAMKTFKAAGGEAAPAVPEPVAAAVAAAPAPAAVVQPLAVNAPPPPNYIEITDNMPPDEVRKARIANSKMRSEYNKALKAAGIDPSTVA